MRQQPPDDYCKDCGKWLQDHQLNTGLCFSCAFTHKEYADPEYNAMAAWKASKNKAKKAKEEPPIAEYPTRKLKIK